VTHEQTIEWVMQKKTDGVPLEKMILNLQRCSDNKKVWRRHVSSLAYGILKAYGGERKELTEFNDGSTILPFFVYLNGHALNDCDFTLLLAYEAFDFYLSEKKNESDYHLEIKCLADLSKFEASL